MIAVGTARQELAHVDLVAVLADSHVSVEGLLELGSSDRGLAFGYVLAEQKGQALIPLDELAEGLTDHAEVVGHLLLRRSCLGQGGDEAVLSFIEGEELPAWRAWGAFAFGFALAILDTCRSSSFFLGLFRLRHKNSLHSGFGERKGVFL